MDVIQLLADAFDVEILVWTPLNLSKAKELDPTVPELVARGARDPHNRQIQIVNWPNYSHWCLLKPVPESKTPDTVNTEDPHLNNPVVAPDVLRSPVFLGNLASTVPIQLVRDPLGHARYAAQAVVSTLR